MGTAFAVLFMAAFQGCGLLAAFSLLPQEETVGPKLLAGSVAGSVFMQWFPALAAFSLGFGIEAQLAGVLLAAACGGGCFWFAKRRGRRWDISLKRIFAPFSRQKLLWMVPALWVFFCLLVWRSFSWEEGRVFSSQATYGDMSMHLSFITSLARQGAFPPEYSLLPGTRLSYPFLSDSISSSLYLMGTSLRLSYCLPMWLAGAQVFFGGWLFLRAMTGRKRRGAIAWTLFFFNGGLGLIYFLNPEEGGFSRIFTEFYQTPTNLTEKNVRWVNVVIDMLLPQRATLFGWAVLFCALYLLYRAVFEGKSAYFLWTGLLAGALPMIHTHSFLALALVCGAWLTAALLQALSWDRHGALLGKILICLGLAAMPALKSWLAWHGQEESPWLLAAACVGMGLWILAILVMTALLCRRGQGAGLAKTWGLLLLTACALALPQLFTWTFQQVGSGSMLRGHFGWVVGEDNYLWFYLKNLGLTAPLALGGLLLAKEGAFARYCPALAIWFLAELAEFQPNDYDNNKLLYVAFLFICCAAADCLCWLMERVCPVHPQANGQKLKNAKTSKASPALSKAAEVRAQSSRSIKTCVLAILLLLMSAPALLTMGREYVSRYELFGEGALSLVKYIEENVEPDAVVLTDQRHNNEVAALAGRNIVCGSSSYLYYHGLDYSPSQTAAREIYEDPAGNRALFAKFGIDYVLVSDFERSSFTTEERLFDALGFPRVYDDGTRVLYRVEGGMAE